MEKPTTSSMRLPLKRKISLDTRRMWRQYVPRVHICRGKGRPFFEDFYTYDTCKDRDEDRSKLYQYLAHNSQIYQNHKSLELEIVVRRVVIVFIILLLLFSCCSPVVQQGCCPFVLPFVLIVGYS